MAIIEGKETKAFHKAQENFINEIKSAKTVHDFMTSYDSCFEEYLNSTKKESQTNQYIKDLKTKLENVVEEVKSKIESFKNQSKKAKEEMAKNNPKLAEDIQSAENILENAIKIRSFCSDVESELAEIQTETNIYDLIDDNQKTQSTKNINFKYKGQKISEYVEKLFSDNNDKINLVSKLKSILGIFHSTEFKKYWENFYNKSYPNIIKNLQSFENNYEKEDAIPKENIKSVWDSFTKLSQQLNRLTNMISVPIDPLKSYIENLKKRVKAEKSQKNSKNKINPPTVEDINLSDINTYLQNSQKHIKSIVASGHDSKSKENFIKIQQALKTKIKNLIS